jgi:sugar-phosphatase
MGGQMRQSGIQKSSPRIEALNFVPSFLLAAPNFEKHSCFTLHPANPFIIASMDILCRALLFDMDGVLVDSTPAVARVWTTWALKHGFQPAEVVRRAHGRPSITTIRELLPSADHHAEDQEIERAEIEDVADIVALPGASQLLEALPPGSFAVVTSATRALATVRLQAAGFAIPKLLITASDIQRGKPHPEPYLRGAAALNLPPTDCVVIEDAPAGVVSGKAAGARVLALRTTSNDFELFTADADWIIQDCSQISLLSENAGTLLLALRAPSIKSQAEPSNA